MCSHRLLLIVIEVVGMHWRMVTSVNVDVTQKHVRIGPNVLNDGEILSWNHECTENNRKRAEYPRLSVPDDSFHNGPNGFPY